MWSLRERQDGSFYLTFDRSRRYLNGLRGIWEFIGHKDDTMISHYVRTNEKAGLLCCEDDEGGVRVLVLE